jgi:hypothetical protein
MTLLRFQSALARVYLDSEVREALRAGDESVLTEFGLEPKELRDIQILVCDILVLPDGKNSWRSTAFESGPRLL